MTNIQNLGKIIIELMEQEAKTKDNLKAANKWLDIKEKELNIWEDAYDNNEQDKLIEQGLNSAYDNYDIACDVVYSNTERLETIEETLKALRKAYENIEWLGF